MGAFDYLSDVYKAIFDTIKGRKLKNISRAAIESFLSMIPPADFALRLTDQQREEGYNLRLSTIENNYQATHTRLDNLEARIGPDAFVVYKDEEKLRDALDHREAQAAMLEEAVCNSNDSSIRKAYDKVQMSGVLVRETFQGIVDGKVDLRSGLSVLESFMARLCDSIEVLQASNSNLGRRMESYERTCRDLILADGKSKMWKMSVERGKPELDFSNLDDSEFEALDNIVRKVSGRPLHEEILRFSMENPHASAVLLTAGGRHVEYLRIHGQNKENLSTDALTEDILKLKFLKAIDILYGIRFKDIVLRGVFSNLEELFIGYDGSDLESLIPESVKWLGLGGYSGDLAALGSCNLEALTLFGFTGKSLYGPNYHSGNVYRPPGILELVLRNTERGLYSGQGGEYSGDFKALEEKSFDLLAFQGLSDLSGLKGVTGCGLGLIDCECDGGFLKNNVFGYVIIASGKTWSWGKGNFSAIQDSNVDKVIFKNLEFRSASQFPRLPQARYIKFFDCIIYAEALKCIDHNCPLLRELEFQDSRVHVEKDYFDGLRTRLAVSEQNTRFNFR